MRADDIDSDLIAAQRAAERLALVVSTYYATLVRNVVPPEQAVMLTYKYQEFLLDCAKHAPQPRSDNE